MSIEHSKHGRDELGRFTASDAGAAKPPDKASLLLSYANEIKSNQALLEVFTYMLHPNLITDGRDGVLTRSDLSNACKQTITSSTLWYKVSSLEEKGLIEHLRRDKHSFRVTALGRQLGASPELSELIEATRARLEMERAAISNLSSVEKVDGVLQHRGSMRRVLLKILELYEQGERPRANPLAIALDLKPTTLERAFSELRREGLIDYDKQPTALAKEWRDKFVTRDIAAPDTEGLSPFIKRDGIADENIEGKSVDAPDNNIPPLEAQLDAGCLSLPPRPEISSPADELDTSKKKTASTPVTRRYEQLADKYLAIAQALEANEINASDAELLGAIEDSKLAQYLNGARAMTRLMSQIKSNELTNSWVLAQVRKTGPKEHAFHFKGDMSRALELIEYLDQFKQYLPARRIDLSTAVDARTNIQNVTPAQIKLAQKLAEIEKEAGGQTAGIKHAFASALSIIERWETRTLGVPSGREASNSGTPRFMQVFERFLSTPGSGYKQGSAREIIHRGSGVMAELAQIVDLVGHLTSSELLSSAVDYLCFISQGSDSNIVRARELVSVAHKAGLSAERLERIKIMIPSYSELALPELTEQTLVAYAPPNSSGIALLCRRTKMSPLFEIESVGLPPAADAFALQEALRAFQSEQKKLIAVFEPGRRFHIPANFSLEPGEKISSTFAAPQPYRPVWFSDGVLSDDGKVVGANFAARLVSYPGSQVINISRVMANGEVRELPTLNEGLDKVFDHNVMVLSAASVTAPRSINLVSRKAPALKEEEQLVNWGVIYGKFDDLKARGELLRNLVSAADRGLLHEDLLGALGHHPSPHNASELIKSATCFSGLEHSLTAEGMQPQGRGQILRVNADGAELVMHCVADELLKFLTLRGISVEDNDQIALVQKKSPAHETSIQARKIFNSTERELVRSICCLLANAHSPTELLSDLGRRLANLETALMHGTLGDVEYKASHSKAVMAALQAHAAPEAVLSLLAESRHRDLMAAKIAIALFSPDIRIHEAAFAGKLIDTLYHAGLSRCALAPLNDGRAVLQELNSAANPNQRAYRICSEISPPPPGKWRYIVSDGEELSITKGKRTLHALENASFILEIDWDAPTNLLLPNVRRLSIGPGCDLRRLRELLSGLAEAQLHISERALLDVREALRGAEKRPPTNTELKIPGGDEVSSSFNPPACGISGLWITDGHIDGGTEPIYRTSLRLLQKPSFALLVTPIVGSYKLNIARWFEGERWDAQQHKDNLNFNKAVHDVLRHNAAVSAGRF